MTKWADKVDPQSPLPEYTRPQLVRENWVNLNGLWDYKVTGKDDPQPDEFQGKILVPFCIESALSGVKKQFTRDDRLWYSRSFTSPALAGGERLILNFGAVDYETTVLVNGVEVATDVFASADQTTVALFFYDANGNQQSDYTPIAIFGSIPFLSGVDAYFPADASASNEVVYNGRTLFAPSWPSNSAGVSLVVFE